MSLPGRLALWLYSLLMRLAQPFLRARLRQRGATEPGYLVAMDERFGLYSGAAPASGGYVWIHAVSLGETRAAAVLVERLRDSQPGLRLLLTHSTATGRSEGARLLRAGDVQAWQPWDTPEAVQRFLARFSPKIGILIETEVWPNLSQGCKCAGVPLVLVNARLSDKSLQKARSLGWLSRPAYAALAEVWAQTGADAGRLRLAGAKVTGVLGNIKFDAMPDAAQLAQGAGWRQAWHGNAKRPIAMLASSRAGEEAAFLDGLEQFKIFSHVGIKLFATNTVANDARLDASAGTGMQWLVVPRHPQRVDEVASLIEGRGLRVSRRSTWNDAGPSVPGDDAADVIWLGDSLGEMSMYYGLADVALLGGSFEALGGQNLIEAAACGCPVIMGPHTFNFAEAAAQAIDAGAALRVATLDEAIALAKRLVNGAANGAVNAEVNKEVNTEANGEQSGITGLVAMRAATHGFTAAHRGAVDKTVAALLRLLRA